MDFNTSKKIRCHDLISENSRSPLRAPTPPPAPYLDGIKLLGPVVYKHSLSGCSSDLTWTQRRSWLEPTTNLTRMFSCACRMRRRNGRDRKRSGEGGGEKTVWCGFGQTVLRSVLGARQVAMRWNANKLPGSRCRSASLCRLVLTLHTHAVFHPF